jgi:hypothetical protein
MKANSVAVVLLVAALSGMALAQKSVLYDDFSQPLLNPQKWATVTACYSANGLEAECVRAIEAGALVLAHRQFGLGNSDAGFQYGGAFVNFLYPASIKSVTTDVVVGVIQESPCAANPQLGGSVGIGGTFFNAGSGNGTDDIGAQIGFFRTAAFPKGRIGVFVQLNQGSNYLTPLPITSVSIGTPVTATLRWDQANHQFVATVTNHTTGTTNQVAAPYGWSDTTLTTSPSRGFAVNNFPANCTNNPTWVYVNATFDNVHISQ